MAERQQQIREILAEYGRLATAVSELDEDTNLFAVGLDSVAIVNVLMALEERFDVELPDELLSRRSFSSIGTLEDIVSSLQANLTSL